VQVDTVNERVIVRYDARKTNAPELHDAILKSGYKPVPFAEPMTTHCIQCLHPATGIK